ncbi:inositol-1-monophosphatase [Candidatus Pantoea edessiphila]|uniref:Inositol-1-monophosphatase n=1 Tax=Candidatus Pantoea edessiphila TaxID=2044610 RepID=A0A2P5SYH4_9GAMM|nr:inositol-1-monophosphatase [Candidatus Pantoea edessiphila]MBK4775520.1 inositol-1-monophosphatase [Pantoea sp. Edef]PPI87353.1 inositol-1-monophosphatase [Candidatus Pantoea edessiphila]
MHPMLNIAIRAVRKAGNLIIKNYEIVSSVKIDQHNSTKIISAVKIELEKSIIEIINKSYPHHNIITEMHGTIVGSNKDIKWIIDPLDCIQNFFKCLPNFSISITLIIKDRSELAVIYAPILNELFSAVRGRGAQLNGYRLRCSTAIDLKGIILAIGYFFSLQQNNKKYIVKISKIFHQDYIDFRRSGSVGLDMAYVAAGRIDGYFDIGLQPWNFGAGELLVKESGGLISDFNGNHNYMNSNNIIAANPQILKAILLKMRNT